MTHSSNQFSSSSPCPEILKLKVADGTLATVAAQRSITLTPTLLLNYVLYLLKLLVDLLSLSKITKKLNNIFHILLCLAMPS